MAFFNDLGKKLSQAGQTAIQKTKEMTEIARLNGAIAEQERKLSDTYIEIGKLYVLTHAEDYDSEFSVMINVLKETKEKINDFRQQIQDIKGVVHCEKCGAMVDITAKFCVSCGQLIPERENIEDVDALTDNVSNNKNVSANCKAEISTNSVFCTQCGTKV